MISTLVEAGLSRDAVLEEAWTTLWKDLKLAGPFGIVPNLDEEARPFYPKDDHLLGVRWPREGRGFGLGSSFLPRHFFKRACR